MPLKLRNRRMEDAVDTDYCIHGLIDSMCYTCGNKDNHMAQISREECKKNNCWCHKIKKVKNENNNE